jgi:hypothetical protein
MDKMGSVNRFFGEHSIVPGSENRDYPWFDMLAAQNM